MKIDLDELCVWKAQKPDIPALKEAHAASVHGLGRGYYPQETLDTWGRGHSTEIYRQGIGTGEDTYFVATAHFGSREIIGYSSHAIRNGKHHLDDLYVRKEVARQGLGTKLLGFVEDAARQQGASSLYLLASKAGEAFYRATGFIEIARREHSKLGNVAVMQKDLFEP